MSVPGERWTPAYDRIFDPDHHLADDPACKRWAWLDLCHMAAWKDRTRIMGSVVVPLKRGELLASIRFLADRWQWSTKKVRIFLEILEQPAVGKVETIRGTPRGTVYRIVNYDTYANPGHSEGHTQGTPTPKDGNPMAPNGLGAEVSHNEDENRGTGKGTARGTGNPHGGQGVTEIQGTARGTDKGTTGAQPGHKEQQYTSGNRQKKGPSLGDPSEDGLARMIDEHPDAGAVLNGLEHPGGPEATAATLRQRFLYADPNSAMPHKVVANADFDTRRRVVAAAFVEYRDQGKTEWSAKLFAGFVRRIIEERSAKTGSSNGGFWG